MMMTSGEDEDGGDKERRVGRSLLFKAVDELHITGHRGAARDHQKIGQEDNPGRERLGGTDAPGVLVARRGGRGRCGRHLPGGPGGPGGQRRGAVRHGGSDGPPRVQDDVDEAGAGEEEYAAVEGKAGVMV